MRAAIPVRISACISPQVRQLVSECAPPPSETDAFDRALIATLSDDPYAAMQSVREAYGDGWVVAHLCDLLWRAGAVSLEPMGEPAVDLRQHFVLQYSKALAGCRALWQLAAAYAIDLLEADPACAPARAWLGQLLLSQRASHTVKVLAHRASPRRVTSLRGAHSLPTWRRCASCSRCANATASTTPPPRSCAAGGARIARPTRR